MRRILFPYSMFVIPLFAALLLQRGEAQEWTRFRGPNGTGISTAAIPVQFTENDYNWKVTLPGEGHSSPVLYGKRLFLTSAEEDKGKRYLLCLNVSDGKTLWSKSFAFSPYPHHDLNSSASSTPTVDSEQVYTTWPASDSFTVTAHTLDGKEVWKRSLGKLVTQHGGASSPIIVGEALIVNVDQEEGNAESFVVGLDRKTGKTLWKHTRPTSERTTPYSTPFLYIPKGQPAELIFSSTIHGITSLNPATGAQNWQLPGLFEARCVGSPVLAEGLIFATSGSGGGEKRSVAVRPGAKISGAKPQVVYKLTRGTSYVPTPVATGGRIYLWGDGGIVTCIRADNGQTVWSERVGGTYYGSPVCISGRLYAMNTKGELVVIAASDTFQVLARYPLGEASHSTPAVAGGVLYLRTKSHLISLGGKRG